MSAKYCHSPARINLTAIAHENSIRFSIVETLVPHISLIIRQNAI